MSQVQKIKSELASLASPEKARVLQGFFKTGKGEYGEGDVFIGVTVPQTRAVAEKYRDVSLLEVQSLLKSRVHEERLAAILILVEKYKSSDVRGRERIVEFYMRNAGGVNNWDLVDLSAPKILGEWIAENGGDSSILYTLAKSGVLWERRIAVVSTFAFIRRGIFGDTLKLSEQMMGDGHDLIHKACGWMLREVGKRDEKVLEGFLERNAARMPRTMLRYAVERLPEARRKRYMAAVGKP